MGRRDAETQSVSTRGVVETQSVSTRRVVESQSVSTRRVVETQSVSTRGVVETQSVSTRGVVETQSARQRMLKCAIAVYMPLDRTEAMEISGVTSGPRRKEQRRPHPSPGCCAVVSCNPNLSL